MKTDTVNSIIRSCENLFIDFYYVPNMDGYLHRSMTFSELGPLTVVKLREEPLSNPVNAAVKRAFDIVASLLFLVVVYPFVWCFVAIGTSLSSPGPILFRQKRTGYKGRPFTMYKFRSMKVNADADKLQATADDPRKTKFGDFLRRSSIDELPQFINVLKGDMSIIGPRPHMELHTEMYTKLVDEYLVRHMVKPGLTGWAQVNGCRGETKTTEAMADRVRYDIWYIEHWSIGLDIKIMLKTVAQILGGDKQAY
ncbi:MAG: exopolysaccharide biosynthesis polyprenyl glycosylphosphotransferase [Bacteroidales bacterium]|nr:exopolysaccharide biosynthesis polyprenyl glycosylphosphotransferase [Bacteroidales bacterium]